MALGLIPRGKTARRGQGTCTGERGKLKGKVVSCVKHGKTWRRRKPLCTSTRKTNCRKPRKVGARKQWEMPKAGCKKGCRQAPGGIGNVRCFETCRNSKGNVTTVKPTTGCRNNKGKVSICG